MAAFLHQRRGYPICVSDDSRSAPSVTLQVELPATPESAARARAAVFAEDHLAADTLENVLVVVSELFANSVRHAGLGPDDTVSVHVTYLPHQVRVAVTDRGVGFDRGRVMQIPPSPRGGFGLRIVDHVAERWGTAPESGTAWAEIARPSPLGGGNTVRADSRGAPAGNGPA